MDRLRTFLTLGAWCVMLVCYGACQSGSVDPTDAGPDGDATADASDADDGGVPDDPPPGTCRDGIRNADEQDVDCGGRCTACSESEADLYVDPIHGDDAADGSRARPLRTPQAARDKARNLRVAAPGRDTPITVLFRDGTYWLEQTLTLEPEDSGTAAAPLVLKAYPGELPVWSGGVVVDGWAAGDDGAWQVTLEGVGEGWVPNQMWIDGQRRYRPQLPKEGFYWIHFKVPPLGDTDGKDNRLGYNGADLDPTWYRLGDVELLIWHHWTISRMRIAELDPATHVVTLTGTGRCDRSFCQFLPGYRYLVENVREALSEPGEWYLDQGSGLLTYLPQPGEQIDGATLIMPRLRQLVRVQGQAGSPVTHIGFHDLAFAHTHFATPAAGYASFQAESTLEAAIELADAEDIVFEGCSVEHTAEYGIAMRERCHRNRIEGCLLRDLGAGAIRIGTIQATDDEAAVTSHNTVRDNLLITGGRMHPAGEGVLIQHAAHNLIEHNDIADFYYTGISVGWRWDYGLSNAHHNDVAYNRVHTIGQHVLSDMGGVYTLGISPGTRVHHNVFHDIRRVRYGGWGIYPDQASSEIRFDHNLVYDTQDAPFHLHFGENLTLEHNVLVDDQGVGILRRSRAEPGRFSTQVQYNVLTTAGALALTRAWTDGQYAFDYNLYHSAPLDYAGRDFPAWQAEGQDGNSVQADPAFYDPDIRDYTFGPDSPATQLGIDPLAVQTAGRLQPPHSTDLPPAPRAFREALGVAPMAVDFEHMTPGQAPTYGDPHDGGVATSLVVTDVTAAAGTMKSLQFQDGPGLDYSYNPHYVLPTDHASGQFRLQFWLRWEQDATIVIEWRDWSSQPYVSGPLLQIDTAGELTTEGQSLGMLPAGEWVHFDMQTSLGEQADGRFTLRLTPQGGTPQVFEDLPARDTIQRLTWVGFIATATHEARFYLDEIVGENQ